MSVQQEIMTATSHFELPVLTWRVAMTVCAGLATQEMAEAAQVTRSIEIIGCNSLISSFHFLLWLGPEVLTRQLNMLSLAYYSLCYAMISP